MRDRAELQSFLGLVNFFGRMIQNFAKMVAPLHQLRRSGTPFIWTSAHQKAFDCTLSQLAKPPLLQAYSLAEEATVATDASETTIAGVLTQRGKPVMYVSRALTSRSAITVILSVKAWQLYGHCCACASC